MQEFEFQPTFGEQWLATMAVIAHVPLQIVLACIFPLVGVSIILLNLAHPKISPIAEFFVVAICFLFTPIVTAVNVWSLRSRNRTVGGTHRVTLDEAGLQVVGPTFEVRLKWAAILRMVETRRFMLFFFGSNIAHFLPIRAIPVERRAAVRTFVANHVSPAN